MNERVKRGRDDVRTHCRTCGNVLGRFDVVERHNERLALVEPLAEVRVRRTDLTRDDRRTLSDAATTQLGRSTRVAGPKRGTGISLERFGETFYFRVICSVCRRNTKHPDFEPDWRDGEPYV